MGKKLRKRPTYHLNSAIPKWSLALFSRRTMPYLLSASQLMQIIPPAVHIAMMASLDS
jgi:hypothetical protein